MSELIERLEKATEPDRDLDCKLAVAIGGFHERPPKYEGGDILYCRYDTDGTLIMPGQAGDMMVPHYTESIDAAMKLMPSSAGLAIERYWLRSGEAWSVVATTGGIPGNPIRQFITQDAKSLAVALCIAAMKARAALPAPEQKTEGE